MDSSALRVASRYVQAQAHFTVGDVILYGKYKNKKGKIVGWGSDKWGNPTVEIEPIPKGRKQNKIFGLFKIWRADLKENKLRELAQGKLASDKPPIYTAVVLDDASHHKLLRWWESEIGPLLAKPHAHHMTIQFKPSLAEAERLPLGEKARLLVVGYAQDAEAQAVLVRPSVPSKKKHPHITVATSPSGGSKHSDALLAQGHERLSGFGGLTLTGVVQAVRSDGSFYTPGVPRPSQVQVDFATRLIQQVGGELPDFEKLDRGEVSSLIQGLEKKRGRPTWYGNGQFRGWAK